MGKKREIRKQNNRMSKHFGDSIIDKSFFFIKLFADGSCVSCVWTFFCLTDDKNAIVLTSKKVLKLISRNPINFLTRDINRVVRHSDAA